MTHDEGTVQTLVQSTAHDVQEFARDLVANVAERAGDVATTAARALHEPTAKKKSREKRSFVRVMVVVLAATAVGVLVVKLVRRGSGTARSANELGPEAGTPSDVPGPAFDEGSPMRAEASDHASLP